MNDIGTTVVEGFVIAPSYDLPELATIRDVDWVDARDPVSITTTYFDTPDRRLARRGVTLAQEYDGDQDTWVVTSAGLRQRLVLGVGGPDSLPSPAASFRGLVGDQELVAKLTLTTLRETSVAMDDEAQPLAQVSIDRISARLTAGHHRRSWDALSVDFLGYEQEAIAGEVRRKLIERGALPSDDLSRIDQLLGVTIPERPRRLPGLVHDYLAPQLDQLIINDVALRRGIDAAHQTRLAARRILSVVRVMADLFEPVTARHLATELGWFASVLGTVTDCDARRKRLRNALTSARVAPGHLAGRRTVRQELDVDRDLALSRLRGAMLSDRYAELFETVADWRAATPYSSKAPSKKKRSVRRYLERAEVELEWRLVAIQDSPSELTMHAARQAARRLRFTAELAQPALGKPAKLARSQAMDVQERLGEHRDAVIAAELSNRLSVALDGDARELLVSMSSQLDHEVELARKRSLHVSMLS